MLGKTLGHYRIVEKIGSGGMGEVYRAHDESLHRDVALKVLPASSFSDPGARARLLREARSAAGLNHPHICTIHEVGEAEGHAYIAMEFLEGQPLSARLAGAALPREQVLRHGLQLAEALAHAHEHGLVHRDLKSANVIITTEGRAKVLDFGLAKRLSEGELDEVTRSQASLTAPGALVGTLAYMAPEQLRGQPADARSDVWALGVVLYEMAAGSRPFQGQTRFELSSAILNERPAPLAGKMPLELRAVIERCLEKEPEQRYQRGGEVQAALEDVQTGAAAPWVAWRYQLAATAVVLAAVLVGLNVGGLRERLRGPTGVPRIESLAVLPLENLSGDPQQEYFADGMTADLITHLANIGAVRVLSRRSVMRFKGTQMPLPSIGRTLKADAILESSVQRSGDRVLITAELIQASTERHLWAKSYERDMRDVLALEDEVAQTIAEEIKVKLSPQQQARLANARRVDPQSYEAFLRAINYRNRAQIGKAAESLERSTQLDPGYAPAYAELATINCLVGLWEAQVPKDVFSKAKELALVALEKDPGLAAAHSALALAHVHYDWNWADAEREFRLALELNPSDPDTHHFYGHFLMAMDRPEESVIETKRAMELEPLSPVLTACLGWHQLYAHHYDQAFDQCLKGVQIAPKFEWAHLALGLTYEKKGMYEAAIAESRKALDVGILGKSLDMASLGHAFALAGQRAEAQEMLARLQERSKQNYVSAYDVAAIYAGLNDKDKAFAWLDKAYAERAAFLVLIRWDPRFDSLHSDPRFPKLVRRLGFPPSKAATPGRES